MHNRIMRRRLSYSRFRATRADRMEKAGEYRATPPILRYVILEQDSIGATLSSATARLVGIRHQRRRHPSYAKDQPGGAVSRQPSRARFLSLQ